MTATSRRIVLASGSEARQAMLEQAGVTVERRPAGLDETPLKARLRAAGATAGALALALARAKAEAVLASLPASDPAPLVIGADQVLTCGEDWHDKPSDAAAARRQLLALRGRHHVLTSAAVILGAGVAPWHAVDRAEMRMRRFSEEALDFCLDQDGADPRATAGAYRLEGPDVQLFEQPAGDWFTILGLPLYAVLQRLRELGAIAA